MTEPTRHAASSDMRTFTVPELATEWNVSEATIRRFIREGRLRAVRKRQGRATAFEITLPVRAGPRTAFGGVRPAAGAGETEAPAGGREAEAAEPTEVAEEVHASEVAAPAGRARSEKRADPRPLRARRRREEAAVQAAPAARAPAPVSTDPGDILREVLGEDLTKPAKPRRTRRQAPKPEKPSAPTEPESTVGASTPPDVADMPAGAEPAAAEAPPEIEVTATEAFAPVEAAVPREPVQPSSDQPEETTVPMRLGHWVSVNGGQRHNLQSAEWWTRGSQADPDYGCLTFRVEIESDPSIGLPVAPADYRLRDAAGVEHEPFALRQPVLPDLDLERAARVSGWISFWAPRSSPTFELVYAPPRGDTTLAYHIDNG